jgi:hypothetical protein
MTLTKRALAVVVPGEWRNPRVGDDDKSAQ